MKLQEVTKALGALAQESRLAVYRLLVKRGPEGFSPGELAEKLGIPAPTLSFHLKALAHAGLLTHRKAGRFIYYSANFTRMDQLVAFLTENCCCLADADRVSACAPVTTRQAYPTKRRA